MAKRPSTRSAKAPAASPAVRADSAQTQPQTVRPLSLDALIGQKRAVDTLRAAVTSQRLHHAWILCGPQGVGKFTAACGFAAELLTDSTTGQNREYTLRALRAGTHPDLHVITKELAESSRERQVRESKQTVIAKDVVAEYLLEPAQLSRVIQSDSAAAKVFIVDEAELLNVPSQNAMLKLLEEPPAGTVLILITTEEHGLLPTIRSRCQRVPFYPLDSAALTAWMASADTPVEGPERDWLIAYGNGSPGQVLVAREAGLYQWHVKLDRMLTALGSDGQTAGASPLGPAMNALVDERAKVVVELNDKASKDTANRRWAQRMLAFVAERLRRQMIGAARAAQHDHAERLAYALDTVSAAEAYLDRNVRFDAVLDNMVAQIATGRAATTATVSL